MNANNIVNTEEVIFCIDLTTDFIKKKALTKIINDFIQEKINLSDSRFGIVIFQEDDNPITVYDMMDANSILNVLEEKWDTRSKTQSYIENELFEILSYVFMKCRQSEGIYRIIVLSDTSSKRPDEYHNAVYDLLMKAKAFSIIIDIIRIGRETFYDDEVKLKVITSETQGGIFICNDIRQFNDVLYSLVRSKREFNIIKPEEIPKEFLDEDKNFYERLAVDLISLSKGEEEICSICGLSLCPICCAYSDEIHKCYNCNTKYHGCCISKYSISNNFGYKHILRCPKCRTLLKLDEDYVNLVYEEEYLTKDLESIQEGLNKMPNQLERDQQSIIDESNVELELTIEGKQNEIYDEENVIEKITNNLETLPPPPSLSAPRAPSNLSLTSLSNPPLNVQPSPPPSPPPLKKVRIGGYFGQEIIIDDKIKNSKTIVRDMSQIKKSEEKLSIINLKPPKKKTIVKFCKICGNSVKDVICCPNCGAKID